MTGSFYGLVIETLVAILLGLTIGYCFILNRRLIRLRADESALRGTIAELITATGFAERAIKNLREITMETNETLGEGLRASIDVTRELDSQIARGEEVLDRIVQIAGVAQSARQREPEPAPANVEQFVPEESRSRSPNRTAQAAQALVMRLRAATGQAA
ncbi:MAG: chemotaxis protein [Xanthobacteraceae bacterium]|nr:chemotaxis protein [Xanthobacteraceae bacterium]